MRFPGHLGGALVGHVCNLPRYDAILSYGVATRMRKEAIDHEPKGHEAMSERHMVAEMMTLLETVWLALDLERHHFHPVHGGWMQVFENWLHAKRVASHWQHLRSEFSPVFQRFVAKVIADADKDDSV